MFRCFSTLAMHRTPLTGLLLVMMALPNLADDWPQWLGPNRDSHWKEDGILQQFPEDGPPLRWSVPINGGYSSPSISDGRVFVMDFVPKPLAAPAKNLNKGPVPRNHNFVRQLRPGTERITCLKQSDGSQLWQVSYDSDYTTTPMYAIGPRCAPTVDGDRVYTLGAEGRLQCLQVATGKVLWQVDFVEKFDIEVPIWGIAAHPLIDGDRLICMVGGKEATAVAFDKHTGQVLWKSLDAEQPGYCAPVIYWIAGRRQLILWHSHAVCGLAPESGKLLWSVPFEPTFAMSIGIPRVEKNRLFVMAFNRKSAAIDVATGGDSAEIAWIGGGRTGIGGVMNMPLIHDGHIYGCGAGGRYCCARLSDGEVLWSTFAMTTRGRPDHWGNVFTIRHADRYFLASDLGDLIIAKMSPEGFNEVSRTHLIDPTHEIGGRKVVWSHPAFAGRCIFLRNDQVLKCYDLGEH